MPCPFRLCAFIIAMLSTVHAAGAAPLPWHMPCVLMSPVALANSVESPYPVLKKNFIFWIVVKIDSHASFLTPNA